MLTKYRYNEKFHDCIRKNCLTSKMAPVNMYSKDIGSCTYLKAESMEECQLQSVQIIKFICFADGKKQSYQSYAVATIDRKYRP